MENRSVITQSIFRIVICYQLILNIVYLKCLYYVKLDYFFTRGRNNPSGTKKLLGVNVHLRENRPHPRLYEHLGYYCYYFLL